MGGGEVRMRGVWEDYGGRWNAPKSCTTNVSWRIVISIPIVRSERVGSGDGAAPGDSSSLRRRTSEVLPCSPQPMTTSLSLVEVTEAARSWA